MSYRSRGSSYRGSSSRRGGWNDDRGSRSSRNAPYYREPSSRGSSRGASRGSSSYRGGYHNEREKFSSYHGDSHYSRGRQHESYPNKRERSHTRGSPERKRQRLDTYSSMGSSHGRDHESYNRRGGYGESSNDRVVFREERHSTRGDHRRSSEYPSYHKSGPSHSESTQRFKSPRGARGGRGSSFRGHNSSFRGAPRSGYVKSSSIKPVFTKRPRNDYSSRGRSSVKLRTKLKVRQAQRKAFLARNRPKIKTEDSGDEKKEDANEGEENEEEFVEEEVEVEVEEEVEEDETKKEVAEEDEGGDEAGDERAGEADETEASEKAKSDKDEKPKEKKVVKKVVKKLVKKPVKKTSVNGKAAVTKDGTENEASPSEKKATKEGSPKTRLDSQGNPYIRLYCSQCEARYVTFREYEYHLRSTKHKMAMRNRAFELKKKLAKLRLKQRDEQREIDAKVEAEGASFKTSFCVSCKLNYKQNRVDHNDSELHKKTKILLNPYCVPCRIRFKTPMSHEVHIASLEHIQRKARHESYEEEIKAQKEKEQEEGKDVNMENFMVLDSVGSGDESGEENQEKSENQEAPKDGEEEKKKKKPKTVNLGGEYCKKITVYYCELCCMQVPRSNNLENALALHCRNRFHLKKYIRARDDRALRKKAEKLHKEAEEQKKEKKATDNIKKEKPDGEEKPIKQEEECDSEAEGKFWKEIESDLPDISDDLGGNKSSDDEDDCNSRFDRFNTKNDDKPIKTETCDVEKDVSEEPTVEETKGENDSEESKK